MRKSLLASLSLAGLVAVMSVDAVAEDFANDSEKVGYIIGRNMGDQFKSNGLEVSPAHIAKGIEEALKGAASKLTEEESHKIMMAFQEKAKEKATLAAKEQAEKGKAYLEKNKTEKGVTVTASGLQYKVLKAGEGSSPTETETVKVHYRGALTDGTVFDSSYDRGEPVEFPVNGVIKGWTEALKLMKPGAKWQLAIPSELAYGARGAGPKIGPDATLLFDVELLEIVKK